MDGKQLIPQGPVDLSEYPVKITLVMAADVCALKLIRETMIDCNWPVNTFNNLAQADLGRSPIQFIATCDTFVGFRDSRLCQLAQDFERKPEGHSCCFGNVLCTLRAAGQRQTVSNSNRVIRFMRDSQVVSPFLRLEQL